MVVKLLKQKNETPPLAEYCKLAVFRFLTRPFG
jgi:hypothetical protein